MTTGNIPQCIIDKYRYINVESEFWFECIWDDFKTRMASDTFGIFRCLSVSYPMWTGFYIQGSGASFEFCGEIEPEEGVDLDAFLDMLHTISGSPLTDGDKTAILAGLKTRLFTLSVVPRRVGGSNYYHEHSVSHSVEFNYMYYVEQEEVVSAMPLNLLAALRLHDEYLKQYENGSWNYAGMDRFNEAFNIWARSMMKDFFKELEAEYERLTSDEAVAEAVEESRLYNPDEDVIEEE
jgi:hypothetical protein